MIEEDIKNYSKNVKRENVGFLLYSAGIVGTVMLGIMKELVLTFGELKYLRTTAKYNQRFFCKGEETFNILQHLNNTAEERVRFYHCIDEKNTEIFTPGKERPSEDLFEKERRKIYEYSKFLRNYLIGNKYVLIGEVIKEKNPKVPLEEIAYGDGEKVYLIQHITFGNKVNEALSYLFKIEKRKKRKLFQTYLVFENGSTIELEEKLKYYFMDRGLKIMLIDKN